jgi:hypothetical protein
MNLFSENKTENGELVFSKSQSHTPPMQLAAGIFSYIKILIPLLRGLPPLASRRDGRKTENSTKLSSLGGGGHSHTFCLGVDGGGFQATER